MADNHPPNFFFRQDQARKNIRKLVGIFILAVTLIIAFIYFALQLIYYIYLLTSISPTNRTVADYYSQKANAFSFCDPSLFFLIAGLVTLFIAVASYIKMHQLEKGGGAIAEMLGGRLVPQGSADPLERRFLNVVEEMAIASGASVPLAYILENEKGINAFAAGLTMHDSAIAVTRGALEHLTRDELQGVVAHEFSHILNGDSRLNTQLIAILYGILIIGIIGGSIIDHHRLTKTSIFVFSAGIVLAIVGYTGSFMGRIIQCAVSRQKELLADASSVQFTRNSSGLANALKKIGGYALGSLINSSTSKQASHLFISESSIDFLFPKLLATHPPLSQRIQLLDPQFDGNYPKTDAKPSKFASKYIAEYKAYKQAAGSYSDLLINARPEHVANFVGSFSDAHIDQSKNILTLIPDKLKQELNVSQSAACLIYALLIGCESDYRDAKFDIMRKSLVPENIIEEVAVICDKLSELGQDIRLPLVELAVPSLLTLTSAAKRKFLMIIELLIQADKKFTLFEFTVEWMINKLLTEKENISGKISFFSYAQVASEIYILLNALAWAGNTGNFENAKKAFEAAVEKFPVIADKEHDFLKEDDISYKNVGQSLNQLSRSSFKIKEAIINACAYCAFYDKTVTVSEADLLRVVSLALGCPLPPFLP
jgi:Zn-dependent protease with chaperone function